MNPDIEPRMASNVSVGKEHDRVLIKVEVDDREAITLAFTRDVAREIAQEMLAYCEAIGDPS